MPRRKDRPLPGPPSGRLRFRGCREVEDPVPLRVSFVSSPKEPAVGASPGPLRLRDAARLVLLVVAAGILGLAIASVFEQPVRPAVHAGVSAAPSSEGVQITAGRPLSDLVAAAGAV